MSDDFLGVIRTRLSANFTQISNDLLTDSALSFKAKGVLCYLLSRPPGWQARLSDIVEHSTDGEYAIRQAVKELCEVGYMRRRRVGFTWETEVTDHRAYAPCAETASERPAEIADMPPAEIADIPSRDNRESSKTDPLVTQNGLTRSNKHARADDLDAFEELWTQYRRLSVWGPVGTRAAALKAWCKLSPADRRRAVDNFQTMVEMKRPTRERAPHASTYLGKSEKGFTCYDEGTPAAADSTELLVDEVLSFMQPTIIDMGEVHHVPR